MRLLIVVLLLAVAPAFAGSSASRPADVASSPTLAVRMAPVELAPADAWPMFRGAPAGNGVTSAPGPKSLQRLLWRKTIGGTVSATAAIQDGLAVVASESGRVVAYDLLTGTPKWESKMDSAVSSSPAIANGRVFFGDQAGVFYALSAKTGETLWRHKTDAEIQSSPTPYKDTVLFGSYDSSLYCMAQDADRVIWSYATEGPVHCAPAVADGVAFIAGCDRFARAVDCDSGKELSEVDLRANSAAMPAISGDWLFAGHYEGQVMGIDWRGKTQIWTYANGNKSFPFYASPAFTGDLVVVGGRDKTIVGLDAKTGRRLWLTPMKAKVDSSPVVSGQRVFAGCDDGNLYEFNLKTGDVRDKFESGGPITASPAVAGGLLVFGNGDGEVFCLGEP